MNERPLVAIACSWIAGTALLSLLQEARAFIVIFAFLLFLAGMHILGWARPRIVLLCAAAILLAFGERLWVEHRLDAGLEKAMAIQVEDGGAIELTGNISSDVEVDGDLALFKFKAADRSGTFLVRVKLSKQEDRTVASAWRRGDGVRISGTLTLPGEAGNFGDFDYRSYLSKMGIKWQLIAKGLSSVEFTGSSVPWTMRPLRIMDQWRDGIGAIMDKLYPYGDAGYMKGLVIGLRSDLDPRQYDGFARIGLTHVLAISGLHVGVIVYILLKFGAMLRFTRERTLALTIAAMPLYMLITGASPSAVRACLMAMLALWLARRNELKDGLHLLLAAAIAMLAWNPLLIEDVSFQLSFLVTAGLILFVPAVNEALPIPWTWLKGPVAVALTAQFISFPVTIYYFHAVHLLSLPANFVLVPFISCLVMPLGMASIALGGIWLPLGIVPAKLATLGNQLTFASVDWLNGFIGLRTVWPQPSLLWVFAAYALMGRSLYAFKRRSALSKNREWWEKRASEAAARDSDMTQPVDGVGFTVTKSAARTHGSAIRMLAFACTVILWLLWGIQPERLNRQATVSFLNVGQGDSILIRTGQGKHILVDAGGTVSFRKPGEEWRVRSDPYEIGRKLIVPLLLKRGIGHLDALVLTHLDADHIGGAEAILSNIPVRALLFNGTIKDSPVAVSLLSLAAAKHIPCYAVHAQLDWKIDKSTAIRVLYPMADDGDWSTPEVWDEQNKRSVTMLLTMYGRTFLLPGDLEADGEEETVVAERLADVSRGSQTGIHQVDVLKAGHHGSKTSTTQSWLDYWVPIETVISVGERNSYGHPNGGVLERLYETGSRVWRTDLNGEIQYRIKPNGEMSRRTLREK
ncbi:DNA internalization-related competence protein ComEC/Rec2 [Cohnella endophytica]|uniref:DNA internalization-related competence protein ComEC/Rec2 n=1 Tax=Cohnella endophytica TaxID=2419778 RepID=A0A494Y5J0_9BACL|nr:DNA internalization-related competence protein ComEC/Rec2 [Cohnella endophytica]RKP55180.1 DNA internalization-related competence protein ComEC/Rec2 [Cohnella endophytica]